MTKDQFIGHIIGSVLGWGIGALAAYVVYRLALFAGKKGWTNSPFDFYGRFMGWLLVPFLLSFLIVGGIYLRMSYSTAEAKRTALPFQESRETEPAPLLRLALGVLPELPKNSI